MLYPFTFIPIFKERVWGGRELLRLYAKALPGTAPIGESWEISDRPGDVSVIANGPLAGKTLRWLMEHHRSELLGDAKPQRNLFPLLIKILDAREKLSLQVHPPAERAAGLGGEPKTEMWHIAAAEPGAELYVGLRKGVTREQFEQSVVTGGVAECFHRVPVKAGDTMFLPSGRVHAIGSGLVIFEIQQNSDTTYRVYDWDRVGLDGKPRELHIEKTLASIDFNDFEPALVGARLLDFEGTEVKPLVRHALFSADCCRLKQGRLSLAPGVMQIIAVTSGHGTLDSRAAQLNLAPGQFALIPAGIGPVSMVADSQCDFLRVEAGQSPPIG